MKSFYSYCISYKMPDCFFTARIGQDPCKDHSLEVVPIFTHTNRHEQQNGKCIFLIDAVLEIRIRNWSAVFQR